MQFSRLLRNRGNGMELRSSDVDLFHCFDRIMREGVHRLFRGCISF